MDKCDYCGEENMYVPIVPKPHVFYSNHKIWQLPVTNDRGIDYTCLDCLAEETELLKECY
jgi:hypothetical protein